MLRPLMPPRALRCSMASCTPLRPEIPKLALAPELSTMTPSRIGCWGLLGSLQAVRSAVVIKPIRRNLIRMQVLAITDIGDVGWDIGVAEGIELDGPLHAFKLA